VKSAAPRARWSAFLLLAAAGCSVGPDYHGPPAVVAPPAQFKGSDPAAAAAEADNAPWWAVFHDSLLDQLEAEAVAANQDLQVAVARIAESQAQARVAAADLYPTLQAEPKYVRERSSNTEPLQLGQLVGANPLGLASSGSPTVLATQGLSRTYNVFSLPVDLNWEVDLFGRVRRGARAARETSQAYEFDLKDVQLSTTANVASDYFSLGALDAELGVLERTLATRRDSLQIAQERLEAGLTSELDVIRAGREIASAEANLFSVQRARTEMEDALAVLLGRAASDFRIRRLTLTALPPRVPAGTPSRLLARRPDIASAERLLAAANERIGVAQAAFLPSLSLTGEAGFESAELNEVFQHQSSLWQFGPSVTVPIFQGGRNRANLQNAKAAYTEQLAHYRKQVLVAFQDVENALVDLRTLAGQYDAEQRAAAADRRALKLNQDLYRKGNANYLDVLDSQRTLLADEQAVAQLLGQRSQATVQLIKALGGKWK
jgi:multidrug efflux system outer membrane protein